METSSCTDEAATAASVFAGAIVLCGVVIVEYGRAHSQTRRSPSSRIILMPRVKVGKVLVIGILIKYLDTYDATETRESRTCPGSI